MDLSVRLQHRSMQRFGRRQIVVLVVAVSDPGNSHLAGQLAGRVSPHSIGDDKQVPAPLPFGLIVGQHDGVRILVCGSPHPDVRDHGMPEAVFPIHHVYLTRAALLIRHALTGLSRSDRPLTIPPVSLQERHPTRHQLLSPRRMRTETAPCKFRTVLARRRESPRFARSTPC